MPNKAHYKTSSQGWKQMAEIYPGTKEKNDWIVNIEGKGLLFNVGSLRKSPPGMDGTTAEPTVRVNYLPDYPVFTDTACNSTRLCYHPALNNQSTVPPLPRIKPGSPASLSKALTTQPPLQKLEKGHFIVKSSRYFWLYITWRWRAPLRNSVKIMPDTYLKAFKILKL